ncbi:NAD-binding protein [Halococcus sp. PRR34]|uniref:potassium channel family protein n=1 Tax=Halococcus sp. PRR34 TaxID=3020830 RepID=UPI0023623DC4|nr:NAD-binding protein [Halococcus sp. PRR34]
MSSEKPQGPLERELRRLSSVSSLGDLTQRQRTVLTFFAILAAIIGVYTVLYNVGMRRLEGDDYTLFRSFQTVINTMTTTGYGGDSPWQTPIMNVFVVWMQLSGVVIGFVTLRILIIPLFERAPVVLDEQLTEKSDHVVVCEYGRGRDVLLDEFERIGIEYVLVDSDKEEAIGLSNRGYAVIDGDPTDVETLERASIEDASLVISDAGDRNTSVALTAHQCNEDVRVVCLTDTPDRREALERAGVDRVVCPPSLIGRQLAEKASTDFDLSGSTDVLGENTVVREVVVRRDGPLHDTPVGATPIVEDPRLTLVAAWIDGELRIPPGPNDRLTPNAVLVVVGDAESFEGIRGGTANVQSTVTHADVIVAGVGVAGEAAIGQLPERADPTTIDVRDDPATDVVGDASTPDVLERAGIGEATALLLTIDNDDAALLATAVARSLTDTIEILVRVTDAESVPKAFGAGADYALSEQRTTARTLAADVFGESVINPVGQIRIIRTPATPFVGRTLSSSEEDSDRGWVLLGVERNGTFRTDDSVEVGNEDSVVVAGTDAAIQNFERRTDSAR